MLNVFVRLTVAISNVYVVFVRSTPVRTQPTTLNVKNADSLSIVGYFHRPTRCRGQREKVGTILSCHSFAYQ